MIASSSGAIDYGEEGSGPTILFVPGSWATRSAWRDVAAQLKDRYRIVTTSLLGYGRTAERRTSADVSLVHEVGMLVEVLDRAGHGAHVVGHSFGACVSLALALKNPQGFGSLTLIEPPLFSALSRTGENALYNEMTSMTDAYFREFESGERRAAARVIDFYGGEGAFDALPPAFRDYVVATTATNILDWKSSKEFDEPMDAFAKLNVPALVVRGEKAHPTMLRITELLSEALPAASLATVKDASHFMIMTHAPKVAALVDAHVSAVEAQRR
ncbi:MAG: alpha/beta hydrolase [Beijerinckiaceae bacterium]